MLALSHILCKLARSVYHPLLVDILWLLEDYSLGSLEEVKDMINNSMVNRLCALMEVVSSLVSH